MAQIPKIYCEWSQLINMKSVILQLITIIILITSCNRLPNTTHPGNFDRPPASKIVWSPEGDELAVTAVSGAKNFAMIYIFDLGTGMRRLILETQEFHGTIFADGWSMDGQHLLISSKGGGLDFVDGIWIVDVSGIEDPEFLVEGYSAAWMPTNELVISRVDIEKDLLSIYIVSLESFEETRIFTKSGITINGFSLTSDGTKLAFAVEEKYGISSGNIYVVDTRTGEAEKLTTDGNNLAPSFTPDGNMIAYTKVNRNQNIPTYPLHIMKSDGSCDIEIPGILDAYNPTWSPDGKQIAFVGDGDIYKVDLTAVFGDSFLTEGLPCP